MRNDEFEKSGKLKQRKSSAILVAMCYINLFSTSHICERQVFCLSIFQSKIVSLIDLIGQTGNEVVVNLHSLERINRVRNADSEMRRHQFGRTEMETNGSLSNHSVFETYPFCN